MSFTNEIVNVIKEKMNSSLEKCLIDVDLESLFQYKELSESQQKEITLLKKEKDDLIDEMNNFKKVSIFKSMTEQLEQKNEEIKVLKSILRNKETVIQNLKTEKTTFNKQELLEKTPINEKKVGSLEHDSEEIDNTDQEITNNNSQDKAELNLLSEDIIKDENNYLTNPPKSSEQQTDKHVEKKEPSELDVPLESKVNNQLTSQEDLVSLKENSIKTIRTIKNLKGVDYYIIEKGIYEILNNKEVGTKVGIVSFTSDKKKKYKFINKK